VATPGRLLDHLQNTKVTFFLHILQVNILSSCIIEVLFLTAALV
jgi:hypothetical protein